MQTVWIGTLKKMRVEAASPVEYHFTDGWWEKGNRVADHLVNDHLGKDLLIRFSGDINCTACGRKTKISRRRPDIPSRPICAKIRSCPQSYSFHSLRLA